MSTKDQEYDIAVISPSKYYKGGIEITTKQLLEVFKNHYRIKEISFRKQVPLLIYPAADRVRKARKEDPIPENSSIIDWFNPFTWRKAFKEFDNKVKILYTPWWTILVGFPVLYLINKSKKNNIKVVVEFHNIIEHHADSLISRISRIFLKKVVKKTDCAILHSKSDKNRLDKIIQKEYRSKVIPLMSHDFLIKDEIDREDARDFLKIGEEKIVMIQFGIVRPYKGVEYSIKATKILKDRGLDVFLLIVGESWHNNDEIISLIEKEDLKNDIEWIDRYVPDQDIIKYFRASNVALFPYLNASQSAAAQVAFSTQIPVVASNVGGFKDIITHRENGMLCEPKDAESLANVVHELVSDSELQSKIVENAQKDIVEGLSLEKLTSDYISIFDELK